jgi:hypothetical protein
MKCGLTGGSERQVSRSKRTKWVRHVESGIGKNSLPKIGSLVPLQRFRVVNDEADVRIPTEREMK